MSLPVTLRKLMRHNRWANDLLFDAVRALPAGEAEKPRTSLFRNMVHMLNHNVVIGRIWQAHLEGRAHGYEGRNTPDHPPLDALHTQQQAVDDWYIAHADRLTEAQCDEAVTFTLIGGNQGTMTRSEILLHIATHCSYHRGFVAEQFFQVPARPPTMDLPVYCREIGEAASR